MTASNDKRFRNDNPRLVRAVTFLQSGQRMESWLPVGAWEFAGECAIRAERGQAETVRAVKLVKVGESGHPWYVNLSAARQLGYQG